MKNQNTIFTTILLVLACFVLLPGAQAVGPDTDGAIPGSNNGEGIGALVSRTTGVWNAGTGFEALNQLTGGNQNTATGFRALASDTNGGFNTGTGVLALFSNINGFFNSAAGAYSLANNISGNSNTANGYAALYRNTANGNTATGYAALYHNTTGVGNTATGLRALENNTNGIRNTADGVFALNHNVSGGGNTAVGYQALVNNAAGHNNTATGNDSLVSNTSGSFNTAIGDGALANNIGDGNIAIGFAAGSNITNGTTNIDIGTAGVAGDTFTIRIGGGGVNRAFIAGIRGVTTGVADAINVMIDSNGQLGTVSSSRRFKRDIQPMEKTSESILALKPVTFHYKSDKTNTPQFGLIAEEVAAVNSDLVVRDEKGEIYSVRYDQVNAMLLNEFLKEHGRPEEQQATIADLKSTVAQQQKSFQSKLSEQDKQIADLASGLAKVNAQLESIRPDPQVVVNNP